jgi:hypothetical protein
VHIGTGIVVPRSVVVVGLVVVDDMNCGGMVKPGGRVPPPGGKIIIGGNCLFLRPGIGN